jgi:hypothetical protein
VEASLGGSVGASGSVAGDWGHLSGSVVASAELRAAAAAYLRAAGGGGEAGVSAEVGLGVQVRARAEASLGGGLVSGRAEGTATAGAGADALARVSLSPHPLEASVQASAGGFAGSRAEFTIRGGVCGVTAGVHGEAWAGVGIRAEVAIGLHDGKFTFSLGLGVALGVGGFLRIDVEIDFQAIGKAIVDFFAQLFGGHPAAGAPGAHAAQLLDRTLASPPEVPEPEPEPEEAGPDVLPGDLALA